MQLQDKDTQADQQAVTVGEAVEELPKLVTTQSTTVQVILDIGLATVGMV